MKSADLKSFRAFLGATQQQLADMLGVSRGTVDNWENKKDPPRWVPHALGALLSEWYKHEGPR